MKILMLPEVFIKLSAVEQVVEGREFSGYGFITIDKSPKDGPYFIVYDVELLDVGSSGYTEFPSSEILKLLDRPDSKQMKLWFHRHPLGDGKPGPHNWSGTDNNTCENEPLGCPDPNAVKWALAMVLTPGGWVGRVDQFKDDKAKTIHIPIGVDLDLSISKKAKRLLQIQKESEKVSKPIEYTVIANTKPSVDTYDSSHAAIDEGFHMLRQAEYEMVDGFYTDAVDNLNWCEHVARQYKRGPYVSQRAKTLLRQTHRAMNKLNRILKDNRRNS